MTAPSADGRKGRADEAGWPVVPRFTFTSPASVWSARDELERSLARGQAPGRAAGWP